MKAIILSTLMITISLNLLGQVTPLLSTTWAQGCNYNAQCPAVATGGACGKVWTGCNATAIAQIFKYYNYPATGMGNHCNSNNLSHCSDFSLATYNYSLMPNNVTTANTEVAKLMYHLGIAVDMQWGGTGGSNSFFDMQPVMRHFKYTPKMYGVGVYSYSSTADLINAIKNELNQGRPVYAKGGNHFYLIDGYNASNQFHMNFGWGGTHDGYYSITSVVNGAGTFTPTNFTFNIRPLDGDLETANDTIVVPAYGGVQNVAFTSLQNWTMTTTAPWITLNQASGVADYFSNAITFNYSVNNGTTRYGKIFIDNGNDIDTVIIKQSPSSLVVSVDSLFYSAPGGSQNVSINWFSYSSWNAISTSAWITVSPASGTGNGTPSIVCATNSTSVARNGYVIITGGVYTDSVFIHQDANLIGIINQEEKFLNYGVLPNPFQDKFTLLFRDKLKVEKITITNICGQVLFTQSSKTIDKTMEIDLQELNPGIYFVSVTINNIVYTQKIIKA